LPRRVRQGNDGRTLQAPIVSLHSLYGSLRLFTALYGSLRLFTAVWGSLRLFKACFKLKPSKLTVSRPNGKIYDGPMKNNQMHGEGTMTYPDGKVKKGVWDQGKLVNYL
jgi:hypothetical protein